MTRLHVFLGVIWMLHQVMAAPAAATVIEREPTSNMTHEALHQVYQENLEPDFSPYKHTSYDLMGLQTMMQEILSGRPPKHMSLIVIKDNAVHAIPLIKVQPQLTVKRVAFIVEGLTNATNNGLKLQDTAVLLNTWDEPRCNDISLCPVPIFSLIKQWDWRSKSGVQRDVLIPFFSHFYGGTIDYPWERKTPKALMRAAAQNGMDKNCTRLWLLELAKRGQRLLDVGITNNLKKGLKVEIATYVDMVDHAKWKYLLSTDGFTASCRFGKLLQTNSVVLKESSPWIEYYYRSVQPGVHFIPFSKDNVTLVLEDLETEDSTALQAVAAAAQSFGRSFLSQHAKSLYFGKAVEMYNKNFRGMSAFISSLRKEDLKSIDKILQAMSRTKGLSHKN